MATYPYTIGSISANNPGLPEILGEIHLNQAVVEGQALDRLHLRHAKATAHALRGMNIPQYPELTEDVVESAQWRADVLDLVHAQSQYMPANLADTLQEIQEQLRDLNNNVKTGRAETANALLRLRNLFIDPMVLSPVQKTVAGSGIQLARALAPDHASCNAINQFATNHPEFAGANIGSTPPLFDPNIDSYQHLEFLKLILFYNEDIGIVAGNGVSDRRKAMRNWLIEL
ncbi:uncharacterized protein LACBIDRAFT_333060 [Laccaria bicolor S238N-H82]|uniref:Predicted protein n=1 Tax=Laccaria bicolor (strain S238N-H82 / ATCC MYA-4686) TaxID=486041 RepID=B0DUQ5_LACBS|nr:uncharacterized protein LACBIDRAFT_333060 [Laccaria bicolor S238N-H82]EDR01655.1 predicted protein [Laccaria bicolor S238N-H82]|eukprot:XP_001887731.1 predicted protein [Laccaria bicolor S238N-H82]